MRYFCAFLFLPALAHAALWPDTIGAWHRVSSNPVTLTGQELWNEYGFQAAESATYESGDTHFTATAWRLQDATAALGAFEWQRPANATPSTLAKLAVETSNGVLLVHANYLLSFEGHKPDEAELVALAESLKNVDGSPLPPLADFLPFDNRVPNSERYILGPVGLEKFAPSIPPATAAFRFGAEAQMAAFHSPAGDMKLAIFNYPTQQIARQRIEDFEKIPNSVVKRSGPLVAVVLAPPNPNEAERLLSLVRYQATLTWDERVPTRRDNIGDLIINAFVLIGMLLIFCTIAGLAYGGLRYVRRRRGEEPDAMITLHLEDSQWPRSDIPTPSR